MASFFEKLIGGQTEESLVKEKKAVEKKLAARTVKKAVKPRIVQEPDPVEEKEEEEEEVAQEEVKKIKPKIEMSNLDSREINKPAPEEAEEEPVVEEEPEEAEEPVKVAPKAEKKPKTPDKEESTGEGQLAIDVYQTGKEIVIQSTIAGVKPDDLEVIIENGMVAVRGSRSQTESSEGKGYLIQECHWGTFSRQFVLPSEVDPSRSEAVLKDGILTIKIPKIQKEKVTKLLIKE